MCKRLSIVAFEFEEWREIAVWELRFSAADARASRTDAPVDAVLSLTGAVPLSEVCVAVCFWAFASYFFQAAFLSERVNFVSSFVRTVSGIVNYFAEKLGWS